MKIARLYDIEWDVDDEDSDADLPKEVQFALEGSGLEGLSEEELEEYGFSDWLSDQYGFCVRTFAWEYV